MKIFLRTKRGYLEKVDILMEKIPRTKRGFLWKYFQRRYMVPTTKPLYFNGKSFKD